MHKGSHYRTTSCLCVCHFDGGADCDRRDCRSYARSEAKHFAAAEVEAAQDIARATAGSTFIGIETPLGHTSRFR